MLFLAISCVPHSHGRLPQLKGADAAAAKDKADGSSSGGGLDAATLKRLSHIEGIDYLAVRHVVEWICKHGSDGAVLIFMPGESRGLFTVCASYPYICLN